MALEQLSNPFLVQMEPMVVAVLENYCLPGLGNLGCFPYGDQNTPGAVAFVDVGMNSGVHNYCFEIVLALFAVAFAGKLSCCHLCSVASFWKAEAWRQLSWLRVLVCLFSLH